MVETCQKYSLNHISEERLQRKRTAEQTLLDIWKKKKVHFAEGIKFGEEDSTTIKGIT